MTHAEKVWAIKRIVADYFGLTVDEMLAVDRHQRIVWARQIAMVLMRSRLCMSLENIGQVFNKDHGTVLHAEKVVIDRCWSSDHDRKEVEAISNLVSRDFSELSLNAS